MLDNQIIEKLKNSHFFGTKWDKTGQFFSNFWDKNFPPEPHSNKKRPTLSDRPFCYNMNA